MEKFRLFLEDTNKIFFKKEELKIYFEEFNSMWDLDISFEKVLDSLRKSSLTYLFDNYWALSKKNPLLLSLEFLDFLGIEAYYGLSSALYFNKVIWQPQLVFKLLNTNF